MLRRLRRGWRWGERGSVSLSGLVSGKRYVATLIAYRGAKRSTVVETSFKTVGLVYPFPMDCCADPEERQPREAASTPLYLNSKPVQGHRGLSATWTRTAVAGSCSSDATVGKLDFMKRWRTVTSPALAT
ncbi:hypothetical protein CRUP_018607 [Coryphaenoides rupestris]|nr:hypothetical protein CRUP_018607 [Coryphaenoides rupestris]